MNVNYLGVGASFGSDLQCGLLGYWKLNESSGAFADSVGSNNGTLSATGTSYASGKLGNGLSIDGASTSYGNVPTSSSLNINGDKVSVSLWVKVDTLPSVLGHDIFFFSYNTPASMYSIRVYADTDDYWICRIENEEYTQFYIWDTVNHPVVDTWYHIVFVCRGVGQPLQFFHNGIDTGQYAYTFSGRIPNSDNQGIIIGNLTNSNSDYATDGIIDEVGLWNRALSTTEVNELYNRGLGLAYPLTVTLPVGLKAYYKMDEVSGTTLDDATGNAANDAECNGTATTNAVGKIGRAVDFTPDTGAITIPRNALLDITDKITISMWIKLDVLPSTLAREYRLICLYDTGGLETFRGYISSDNYLYWMSWNSASTAFYNKSTDTINDITNFIHVVFVSHGIGTYLKLYINGVSVGSRDDTDKLAGVINPLYNTVHCIGNSWYGGSASIDGKIDEVGIWARDLSAAEVLNLYTLQNTGTTYPF